MANKNRYKFHFGEKNLTLTTDKDNLFMEEVERVAYEKYKIIKILLNKKFTIKINTIYKKIQNYVFMYKKKKQKKIPEKVPVYDEEYMIPK